MQKLFPWMPQSNGAEVDHLFDYTELRAALLAKASWLWWQPGIECPCFADVQVAAPYGVEPATNYRPRINCHGCGGTGVLYSEGQAIPALIYSARFSIAASEASGLYVGGQMLMTTLREHQLTPWDRLMLISDTVPTVGKAFKAAEGPIAFRYPVVRKQLSASIWDGTACQPGASEYDVLWLRYSTADGQLDGAPYDASPAYTLDPVTGRITVPEAPIGAFVAARFFTYPIYKVKEAIRATRHSPARALPGYSPTGDGMNQYVIVMEDFGSDPLVNPSATFIPPQDVLQCLLTA